MEDKQLEEYYQLARNTHLFKAFYDKFPSAAGAPVLNKAQLVKILNERFVLQAETKGVYLVRSGGSTLKPLVFPVDIAENQAQREVLADGLTRSGIFSPRTIALNMFGYMDMYRTAAILDDILEKCQATTLAVSANTKYEDAYDTAQYFKPDFIFGTPSKMLLFARHLQREKKELKIANLLFGGEFLHQSYQELFRRYLGVKQIYSIYGSAETGIWAWSDYSATPSVFRIIDGVLVEIADADASGFGNIVVTNFFRRRFPVFRYNSGDVGRLITVAGNRCLELKTREMGSFTLYESNYSIDDFAAIFSDVDGFQIHLTNQQHHTELKFLLKKNVSPAERKVIEQEKLLQIENILGYKLNYLSVEVCGSEAFHTDPVTCKTPLIVDSRV